MWGNTLKKYLHKIIVKQNKVICIICYAQYNAHTSPPFKNKNILIFNDVYKLLTCQLMFKISIQTSPIAFHMGAHFDISWELFFCETLKWKAFVTIKYHTEMVFHLYAPVGAVLMYPFENSICDKYHTDMVFHLYAPVGAVLIHALV